MSVDDPRVIYWWIQAIAYAVFAAVGGFMGYLLRAMDQKVPISWNRAFLEAGSAAFVGALVMMVCQAMDLSASWTGIIVGVSGWLGASVTIRMLESIVRKKLGLDPVSTPAKEPEG